jgi:hypothetical protein
MCNALDLVVLLAREPVNWNPGQFGRPALAGSLRNGILTKMASCWPVVHRLAVRLIGVRNPQVEFLAV